MTKHRHSELTVERSLSKKNDIRVLSGTKHIEVLKDKVFDKSGETIENPFKKWDLGNNSWGKIDFLVNHCGYSLVKVDEFQNNFKFKN